ncbi:50S ribosomal protein L24 [Candidatus Pacearchaeota archaeon CG11_big_fil_rev_8_21_14_0_20_30_13]|nr:MAG: 50S ribosomal protein L24 [Candidatus Pacearchaeota archaeon CG11_big_fil_rev_8_21_14_0_20_30_13]
MGELKMPKCVYCEKSYEFPRGLTLVMKDGTVNYLCSSKCRKNMAMGRRKVRWLSTNLKFNPKNKIKTKKRKK